MAGVHSAAMKGPSVLLVAGAYFPEISAAGLQCQAVAAELGGRARMSVLATAVDRTLPANEVVDGVSVARVIIDVRSALSKIIASIRLLSALAARLGRVDVIHVHGVSQKNLPAAVMAPDVSGIRSAIALRSVVWLARVQT